MKKMICLLSAFVALSVFGSVEKRNGEIVRYNGKISKESGWSYVAPKGGNVYIPFEGVYEDKGGKFVSSRIRLNKKQGEHVFYRLDFTAKTNSSCFWWIEYFDAKGNPLPDCNCAVYPGPERRYSEVFQASANAAEIQIIFSSQKGVSVRDIVVTRITDSEAAKWCDDVMKDMLDFAPAIRAERNETLVKTKAALTGRKPFRVVLLGDSIVNDTYTSNFIALFNRTFPGNKFQFILSVRGSTGCWFYKDPENFQEYVGKYKPDLVIIGGISNRLGKDPESDAMNNMKLVIEQSRAIGAEVAITTPAPSWEWRKSPEDTTWSAGYRSPSGILVLDSAFEKQAATATGVAIWDLTSPTCDYISKSRKEISYFRRDVVHNNDRGKQLIGRTLVEYFRLLAK